MVVTGFQAYFLDAKELATLLRNRLATSVSVQPLPDKPSLSEILIQGSGQGAAEILQEVYKLPSIALDFEVKKKKTGRT